MQKHRIMEFFLSLTTITLCSLLLVYYLRAIHIRRKTNLPPGRYGLPFIGETIQLIMAYKSDNPQPFFDKRVAKFGPIFTTHFLGEPTVVSADPEFNRYVLQNEFKLFHSNYPTFVSNIIGKYSLLLMKDEKLHKRLYTLTITYGAAGNIRDNLFGGIDALIRSFLNFPNGHIFLLEETKKIAFALTIKHITGIDPCDWTEILRKEYLLFVRGFFVLPSTFLSKTYRRAMKARAKVVKELIKVVNERRTRKEEGGQTKDDIIGRLLHEEARRIDGKSLSEEEIADFLVAILVASFETTSSSMTIVIMFLTNNPLALSQLKEEQEKIRSQNNGDGKELDWNDYKSMPFSQCVIDETLRRANLVTGIFRRTTSEINFKGYTIPKGWKVMTSLSAVHMNDDHFKDAYKFNPWRWQTDSPELCSTNLLTPFGGGPRLCPGFELARVSLSIFLHHFVTKYSWEPTEKDKLVFFPITGTKKQYPIYVQKRELGNSC